MCLTLGVILYIIYYILYNIIYYIILLLYYYILYILYYIVIHILYILYYYILYYTLPSSPLSYLSYLSSILLPPLLSLPFLSHSSSSFPHPRILVATWIRLFILYYSIPIFFSAILPSFQSSFSSSSTPNPYHLIHSIRVGTWIHLFIFRGDSWDDNLTPHVLSEWMVEVCHGD